MTPDNFREQFHLLSVQERQTVKRFLLEWSQHMAILHEDTTTSDFDRHYIYHTAWAARILARTKPALHYDFSSSLYFAAIASAWTRMIVCDYRPPALHLDGIGVRQEDLMRLSFADGSLPSISSMHVVEHVGLGRYGDRLDYDGDLKAVAELVRVLAIGGDLLFAVPIAAESAIIFNAHRVYSIEHVLSLFQDTCELVEQAVIPDVPEFGLLYGSDKDVAKRMNIKYGCGCFWFKKK